MTSERWTFALRVFELLDRADVHGELFWRVRDDELILYLMVNDVFAWGFADLEEITMENLPVLEQALVDLEAIDSIAAGCIAELFAARVRKMRPQGAWYQMIAKGWDPEKYSAVEALFNAAGPERELSMINPKPLPSA
jgi:hypothetical protein